MIRLTSAWTKESIWLNPDHLVDFGKGTCQEQESTYITTVCNVNPNDTFIFVTESPEEVARKVLEYRLSVIQYQTYLVKAQEKNDWTRAASLRKNLSTLAGLEEQKDE